ncbi:unnamed protein product [Allacma fusca]|uniref:Uncharacterized protein n=1 Tax=Allacma fusca TaxID=39272 RepID=A0A8J2NLV9_9HEXA|nr:unnamed protein product [Allacma fusca]
MVPTTSSLKPSSIAVLPSDTVVGAKHSKETEETMMILNVLIGITAKGVRVITPHPHESKDLTGEQKLRPRYMYIQMRTSEKANNVVRD